MLVIVHNLYTGTKKTVEGTPHEVQLELLRSFPFLNSENPEHHDIANLVDHLNTEQALEAEVVDHDEKPLLKAENGNLSGDEDEVVASMLGYNHKLFSALEAVKFLAGGAPADGQKVRQALWEADGDPEEAALLAYGMEVSAANLSALRGVQGLSKAESQDPVKADTIQPGSVDADQTAIEVDQAFRDNFVLPVKLGGKHSKGSLLARDQASNNTWLLKPGSGGQTPAAGASQDPSTQSRREAAFYQMADAWHLAEFFPRADLLLIDGKEYAALHLLPWVYKGMDKLKAKDVQAARAILSDYLKRGILHRWAVLDFVLGNPDRHAGNLMVHDGDVKLIDHGSAFAGTGFDPAHDQYSFTPYYLRAWADGKFSKMDAASKLKVMPRLDRQTEENLKGWIEGLKGVDLDKILGRYGIDPEPSKFRLAQVQAQAAGMPADEAINKLWVDT